MNNLHRIAGGLAKRRQEAVAGRCAIGDCHEPAAGYIEGWDLRPAGVCARHAAAAPAHGYTVHRAEDIP